MEASNSCTYPFIAYYHFIARCTLILRWQPYAVARHMSFAHIICCMERA